MAHAGRRQKSCVEIWDRVSGCQKEMTGTVLRKNGNRNLIWTSDLTKKKRKKKKYEGDKRGMAPNFATVP